MSFSLKTFILRCIHYPSKFIYPLIPVRVPELISGPGAVRELPESVKSQKIDKVLIVTDKGLTSIGLAEKITGPLEAANIPYCIFDGVQPNPSIQNIEDGLKVYDENNCSGIIAFGGGSPMDCAKMIGARASNRRKPVRKMQGKFRVWRTLPPLIAIPTTAGTGSEGTVAAVVSDPDTHEKFAVIDLKLVPQVAILDAELMLGLPPHVTSTTGMDALTHAVESYIGLMGTPFTRKNSLDATKIIMEDLEDVYQDGSNPDKRDQLALASYYAGLAFTRTWVGYVHAIAHNMGGLYGVPHGLANAIILPYVLEASIEQARDKLADLAVVSGLGRADYFKDVLARKFIDKIKRMNQNMGIPTFIKELKEEDIPLIVKRALAESNIDYPVPRIMNKQELTELVRQLLP
ncbi:MAG: iron-containing alcohol dehydrogenase [Proteobacteria bacterium]|nr:iron-containing alcohol dehydrogenase [Pseudomonadota bacterium]